MHIYVMRHGQTVDNAHKLVSGDRETLLSELGKRQAKLAGQKAKKISFDLIVTSPLRRAKQTAKIVAEVIGYPESAVKVIDELRERHLGVLEGASYASNERLNGNFPAVEHIHKVEPLDHFHARVQHSLREIMRDKKHTTILIVCHSGVLRMLRVIAEGKKPHAIYDYARVENATIHKLM
jgi:broad specificity phosphatase PhoE